MLLSTTELRSLKIIIRQEGVKTTQNLVGIDLMRSYT